MRNFFFCHERYAGGKTKQKYKGKCGTEIDHLKQKRITSLGTRR
jgi:hypothetical protein